MGEEEGLDLPYDFLALIEREILQGRVGSFGWIA